MWFIQGCLWSWWQAGWIMQYPGPLYCASASPVLCHTALLCSESLCCCFPMAASREMGYLRSRLMRGEHLSVTAASPLYPTEPHPSLVIAGTQLMHTPARVSMYKYEWKSVRGQFSLLKGNCILRHVGKVRLIKHKMFLPGGSSIKRAQPALFWEGILW